MPPVPSSMKLLIDTRAQRVLFAEAGKDVADFILGLVTMPLGAVHRLIVPEGGSFVGSIGNVYDSAEKMDATYMQSTAAWNTLLVAPPVPASPSLAPASASLYGASIDNFRWPSEANHALPPYLYRCTTCQSLPQGLGSKGFVKDMAKYTVMDDLTVTPPTSNVSSVALLKNLGVKDLDALEERAVNVDHEEAVDILKAALSSKTVLTDVFLKSNSEHIVSHHRNGTGTPTKQERSFHKLGGVY